MAVDTSVHGKQEKLPKFNVHQWLSLLGLLVLAVGALFLSWNVGLTGFLVGSVLIILGSGEEKKAVSAIPWNVILMVMGVGILMNIISIYLVELTLWLVL